MPYFPPDRTGVTSRIRLRGHDYSTPGYYFITTCIYDRSHRLGTIAGDQFIPNAAGEMIDRLWHTMPGRFPGATMDTWCLMPNHFHAIVGIGVDDEHSPPLPSLSSIMNWFKSVTTVEYIRGVKEHGWPRYHKQLWLEGYNEHIVRTERDLDRVRDYIDANAANWKQDGLYLA